MLNNSISVLAVVDNAKTTSAPVECSLLWPILIAQHLCSLLTTMPRASVPCEPAFGGVLFTLTANISAHAQQALGGLPDWDYSSWCPKKEDKREPRSFDNYEVFYCSNKFDLLEIFDVLEK
ncbi:hypothetical protein B0H14DRAFT_2610961 [Mycena olivaceomarginata]|nr:hypothetical protein B0H14DRAFT_2610961 [Mycena olivaceomarginata]